MPPDPRDPLEPIPPVEDGIEVAPSGPPAIDSYRVTDVSRYFAIHRGLWDVINSVAAIQQAIRDTPNGGVVYFPAGTYVMDGVVVYDRRCLTFAGDGPCSVIKWVRRTSGFNFPSMVQFDSCPDLTIMNLAFDGGGYAGGGIEERGLNGVVGLNFCDRFRIIRNVFFDSNDFDGGATDRRPGLEIVNASGVVADNVMRRYGIAVSSSRGVRIVRNAISETTTAGIDVDTGTNGNRPHLVENLRVEHNTIVDARLFGILLNLKGLHSVEERGELRRVEIVENVVRFTAPERSIKPGGGIALVPGEGTGEPPVLDVRISDNTVVNERTVFAEMIDDTKMNGIRVSSVVTDLVSQSSEDFRLHEPPPFHFLDRLEVSRNQVVGFDGVGIEITGSRNGTVGDNGVYECGKGIALHLSLQNHIHSNRVLMSRVSRFGADQPTGAYVLGSLGGNIAAGNVLLDGAHGPFWEASELYAPIPHQDVLGDRAFETDDFTAIVWGIKWIWEPRWHDWEVLGGPFNPEENR